ncbi:MAG TPA: choice-of-anchor tandem repeat GloVer-containing protein, partial [Candidatus Acidoferrum sp.]|nr:choice-of-anchor tandem repeat GloVer-containing protein [Candidatus Acidoferrum sp.]
TLYGTTENGGLVGKGTLFRIGTDGSGFATLHNFEGSDGSAPYSTLVMSGTALYGTTVSGGNYTDGTVFTINTDGTDFSILHHFSGSDGRQPYAGLLLSGHILYGTTMFGGTFDLGTVFKVSTDGSDFATIYSFSISYGYCPNGMPVLAGSTLYGTLSSGGMGAEGAIFAVNIDGTGFTPIHSFEGCVSGVNGDGAVPYSGLVVFGGMLYGTAVQGGACGGGSVFASALLPMGIPSAANITVATLQDHPLKLAVAKLLALTHGPEGDALALTGVSAASTNGGSVVLGPDQITYTPAAGYIGADCFIYSVSDAMDATASAYVFVQVLPTNQISGNMLPLTAIPGGYQVSFAGIPGRTYSVQRAPTINGPWVTIGTIRVGSNGLGIIQDTNPPEGAAFYRTTYP